MVMKESNENGYVKWKVFVSAITILVVIGGTILAIASSALQKTQTNEVEIREVKTAESIHFESIKEDLSEIKSSLKSLNK